MYKQRPRIIPTLLLSNQNLVKTINFKNPNYLGDPINAVKIFNEEGVDELSILDIEATKQGKGPDFDYLKSITSEAFMPLSYGGGITNIDQIKELFHIGFEKVVINSALYSKPELITEAADIAGSQSIVVSIDVKKGFFGKYSAYSNCGMRNAKKEPQDIAVKAAELGAGELFLQSIDRDGKMTGYDDELVKMITSSVKIPVIACSGAGTIHDLQKVIYEDNAHAAAAGSMFVYYGKKKAVLINFPTEKELEKAKVYR